MVEVATPVLFVLAVTLSPNASLVDQLSKGMLLALLLALTVIDLHALLLPDSLVAATAVVGVLRSLVLESPPFADAVFGGSVGLVLLGFLALLPWRRAINGADRAPTTAVGLGDAKLAGAMGLTLGLQGLLTALLVAFVVGGLVAGLLLLSKRATLKSRIPFGPFLAGATALLLVIRELPEIFFRLAGF
jgi:leader peptidase (prepilin peptidase)/N-methyltransferase